MSRAIEDYVCASEDRSHYNTDDWLFQGWYYFLERPCKHILFSNENLETQKNEKEKI